MRKQLMASLLVMALMLALLPIVSIAADGDFTNIPKESLMYQ